MKIFLQESNFMRHDRIRMDGEKEGALCMFQKMDKMKIKEKMKFGYGLVIGLMVLITVVAIVGLILVQGKMNSYINGAQAADTAVKVCRIETNIAARNIREMTLNKDDSMDEEYKANIQESIASMEAALQDLQKADVVEVELNQRYEDAVHNWVEIGNNIVEKLDAGELEEGTQLILNECAPALQEVVSISKEIDVQTDDIKQKEVNLVRNTVIFVAVIMIIVLVIALFAAIKVGGKIIESIVKPLREIETAAVELSHGNLHAEIAYRNEDEIGTLAHALRSSISRLWSYVEDIDRAMKEFAKGNFDVKANVEYRGDFISIEESFMHFEENIADMVKNVQAVANQVTRASEQIAASSTELAEGATEQAGVTQELFATIESVSEQIDRNAKEAMNISKEVQQVGVEIDNSNGKMQEMVDSMNRISESSNEISKIIATINEIAAQTNLLALNASIEAARAGEAGKGFAVVADQVSLLAAQSAEAATESTTLIEESVRAVKGGMQIANETAGQLESVVKGSRAIIKKVNLIAEASEEQADAVTQINHGVDQINDVVQTNSATSEQCAASSQEMTAQAETLKGLIQEFRVGKF